MFSPKQKHGPGIVRNEQQSQSGFTTVGATSAVWPAMPSRYQYTMRDTAAAAPLSSRPTVSSSVMYGEISLVPAEGEEIHYKVHRVFPQRRSRYINDSVHRTQNNLLRALGTSESQAIGPTTTELSLQKSPSLETQPIKGKKANQAKQFVRQWLLFALSCHITL